jgi:heme-degrading monooxygenase HmoA
MRFRRGWPELPGAVGLWTWLEPRARRVGSVSVWESEADLERFVRSTEHLAIVREFRSRMSGTTKTWQAPQFARAATWNQARQLLSAVARTEA